MIGDEAVQQFSAIEAAGVEAKRLSQDCERFADWFNQPSTIMPDPHDLETRFASMFERIRESAAELALVAITRRRSR